jgi:hypothetical protein
MGNPCHKPAWGPEARPPATPGALDLLDGDVVELMRPAEHEVGDVSSALQRGLDVTEKRSFCRPTVRRVDGEVLARDALELPEELTSEHATRARCPRSLQSRCRLNVVADDRDTERKVAMVARAVTEEERPPDAVTGSARRIATASVTLSTPWA